MIKKDKWPSLVICHLVFEYTSSKRLLNGCICKWLYFKTTLQRHFTDITNDQWIHMRFSSWGIQACNKNCKPGLFPQFCTLLLLGLYWDAQYQKMPRPFIPWHMKPYPSNKGLTIKEEQDNINIHLVDRPKGWRKPQQHRMVEVDL